MSDHAQQRNLKPEVETSAFLMRMRDAHVKSYPSVYLFQKLLQILLGSFLDRVDHNITMPTTPKQTEAS